MPKSRTLPGGSFSPAVIRPAEAAVVEDIMFLLVASSEARIPSMLATVPKFRSLFAPEKIWAGQIGVEESLKQARARP